MYFIYVKRSKIDITSLGGEYLAYIGGQNHILCSVHGLPLINSTEKNTHVPVTEKSFTDAIQLIAWLVFATRCENQLDKDQSTKFLHPILILIMIDSEESTEIRKYST